MTVKRIVANIEMADGERQKAFYSVLFKLEPVMDFDWIVTLAAPGNAPPQLSIARHGGSGADLPALSIEVDDLDAVHQAARQFGAEIVYPVTEEPWGVRRFFVRDPSGVTINVIQHMA